MRLDSVASNVARNANHQLELPCQGSAPVRRELGLGLDPQVDLGATSQPIDNYTDQKPPENGHSKFGLYQAKSSSYHLRDGRAKPPSQKDFKKIRRQPDQTPAGSDLISERQRLVALIADMPDEVLKEALPSIVSTLRKVADQSCAKATRRAGGHGSHGNQFRPTANACTKVASSESRHTNGKVKKLPKLEKPLHWPKKKFSKEYHRRGISIIDFLREEWAGLVEAGYGELRWLRIVDASAAAAVENYERKDPKTQKRKQLPMDIRFLREKEVIDAKLAMGIAVARQDHRLLDAAARRVRRGELVAFP